MALCIWRLSEAKQIFAEEWTDFAFFPGESYRNLVANYAFHITKVEQLFESYMFIQRPTSLHLYSYSITSDFSTEHYQHLRSFFFIDRLNCLS